MVSVKIKLRESRREGNVGKLFIQIIHKREIKTLPTPFKLLSTEWNQQKQCFTPDIKNVARAIELYEMEKELASMLKTLNGIIQKISRRVNFTTTDIVNLYLNKSTNFMFLFFMKKCIRELEKNGKDSTAKKYEGAARKFLTYRNGVDIPLNQITAEEMAKFERYLIEVPMSMNTVSFYMRIIRAVYNRAVSQNLVLNNNPFKDVYTGVGKTIKRAVSADVIEKLQNMTLPPSLAFTRDMFLFSFYTRGMSFVDMANLKKEDRIDNLIHYRRSKTNQLLTIHIEPCAEEIIARYANRCRGSNYLLPIMVSGGKPILYTAAIQTHNDRLKTISKMLSINPPLTSYVSRHTWASLARRKGINISIISEGMGHSSERTTQIYLSSFDQNLMDKVNKMVIGKVKKATIQKSIDY